MMDRLNAVEALAVDCDSSHVGLITEEPMSFDHLDFLVGLETKNRSNIELAKSQTELRHRIDHWGSTSFLFRNRLNQPCGALYVQRTRSPTADATDETDSEWWSTNHDNEPNIDQGNVIRFVNVLVDPETGIGSAPNILRWAKLYFGDETKFPTIDTIVAYSRCSNSVPEEEYEQYALSGKDPTLAMHLSNGATIVRTVPNYRPTDKTNYGNAVLVCYKRSGYEQYETHKSHLPNNTDTTKTTKYSVAQAISRIAKIPVDAIPPDTPLRELGFDSLDMMELGL